MDKVVKRQTYFMLLLILLFSLCACSPETPKPDATQPLTSDATVFETVTQAESNETSSPTEAPELEPPLDDDTRAIAVPDFLDPSQELLYRQAYSLYTHMFSGDTTAIEYFETLEKSPEDYQSFEQNGMTYLIAQGRYRQWQDFDALIHAVFTESFWTDKNQLNENEKIYMEKDGYLSFIDLGRGSGNYYNPNFSDTFECLEKTEDRITFNLVSYYSLMYPLENESKDDYEKRVTTSYEYSKTFLIEMVKVGDGWRFQEFHTGLADEGSYEGTLKN